MEEEEPEVNESQVQEVFDRMRSQMAELVEISDKRKPVDGDVVQVNFAAYDLDGTALQGMHADNFQLTLGEAQVLARVRRHCQKDGYRRGS